MREFVSLAQLRPWPENYRRGDVPAIIRSIRAFGFNSALRVRNNLVYAGNHAFLALQQMESEGEPVPTGIVADPSGAWLVPCIVMDHLSEEQAEAFAIADNRTQELGSSDDEQLLMLLGRLSTNSIDLESMGYSSDQLDALLAELSHSAEPHFEPVSGDSQPVMDEPHMVTCPECGHRFEWEND